MSSGNGTIITIEGCGLVEINGCYKRRRGGCNNGMSPIFMRTAVFDGEVSEFVVLRQFDRFLQMHYWSIHIMEGFVDSCNNELPVPHPFYTASIVLETSCALPPKEGWEPYHGVDPPPKIRLTTL